VKEEDAEAEEDDQVYDDADYKTQRMTKLFQRNQAEAGEAELPQENDCDETSPEKEELDESNDDF
jgi:hypothetical protein